MSFSRPPSFNSFRFDSTDASCSSFFLRSPPPSELSIDTSRSNTPAPTVTISDIDATSMLEGQGKNGAKVVVVDSEGKTVGAVSPSSSSSPLMEAFLKKQES